MFVKSTAFATLLHFWPCSFLIVKNTTPFSFSLSGDAKFVYQFLQKLILVDRFDMTLMFLSQLEKQGMAANLAPCDRAFNLLYI